MILTFFLSVYVCYCIGNETILWFGMVWYNMPCHCVNTPFSRSVYQYEGEFDVFMLTVCKFKKLHYDVLSFSLGYVYLNSCNLVLSNLTSLQKTLLQIAILRTTEFSNWTVSSDMPRDGLSRAAK